MSAPGCLQVDLGYKFVDDCTGSRSEVSLKKILQTRQSLFYIYTVTVIQSPGTASERLQCQCHGAKQVKFTAFTFR